MVIQRLSPSDVAAYRRLRLRCLKESPTAFGSSYAEEAKFPLQTFVDRVKPSADKWVFGAFDGKRLIGVVTLIRESRLKHRHKAGIFGMYVAPSHRRQGIGRQLVERAMAAAEGMKGLRQVNLSVMETNRPAAQLYESLGFKTYGCEKDSLLVAGKFYAELFMVYRL